MSSESLNAAADNQNRIHKQTGADFRYDAAGNMTFDPVTSNSYAFDPENRITGAGGYTYTYDADGNRVEKSNGTTGTIYWYTTSGIVAESDLNGNLTSEYVFFDGDRIARKDFPGNNISYYFSDHLKTASVVTDAAGNITEDEDFYPWGGEVQFVNSDSNHYKFGGHERDTETALYYFGARYYGNWAGRFLTPDWDAKPISVPYADFGNPQSLNLYSYTKNNPTTFGDTDGHCWLPQGACDFVRGALNALGSDNLGGAGRSDDGGTAYHAGQALGDGLAVIEGGAETAVGAGGEVAGTAVVGTGVGAPAGIAVDAASATLLVHGSSTFVTAGQHLLSNSSSTSGSGSSSGTEETSADTVRAAQREAQRQEGIPTSQQPDSQKSTNAGR